MRIEGSRRDEAEQSLHRALVTFRGSGEAAVLADLGLLHLRRDDLPTAIENLTASVEVFRRLNNRNWFSYIPVTFGKVQMASTSPRRR